MALKDDKAQGEEPKPRKKPGPKPGDPANTAYRPEMCELIIGWGREGKSRTWMCAELDITRETLAQWEKLHPQLTDALTRARVLSQRWWEDAAQENLKHPTFKDGLWRANMASRFRDEWTETKNVNQTNEDGPARAKATAEDRSRTLELLGRLGLGASPVGTGSGTEQESEEQFQVVRTIDRRSGRAS
jgi:hypothetical protein